MYDSEYMSTFGQRRVKYRVREQQVVQYERGAMGATAISTKMLRV